ncbi:hypothetical protein F0562_003557 [Nyssa sinensis]|uniref:Uncharacterized protein n=1 Tax=Nyssa sinensis TaxID=561372 RepID=A0A5J5BVG9_9ASTE|nr:hypothetical protein F0562_003557 [Nyssa sinensis]
MEGGFGLSSILNVDMISPQPTFSLLIITVLGDIQFVPKDACIVDLRIGLPNEVPGCFGVLISIRAERPNDPVFNRELVGGALEERGEARAGVDEGGFSPVLEVLIWVFELDGKRPAHINKHSNIRVMDLWR